MAILLCLHLKMLSSECYNLCICFFRTLSLYEKVNILLVISSETDELIAKEPLNVAEPETTNDDKQMTVSKELSQEKAEVEKAMNDNGIVSVIYSAAKKFAIVGVVYFVGYMNWSVAWLICPLLLSVFRDQFRSKHDIRREVAKASAMASDKEVILARLDDLPAWVFFPDVERCEWLNKVLKQVWPNANHFTRNLIKESIEPSVQKALAGYKLNNFKFDRMILGTIVSN